jgi:site-specific DNA-cytosine methylase
LEKPLGGLQKRGDFSMIQDYTVLHLFSGIGGAALGFQQSEGEWKGIPGRFYTLAGIDCDQEACQDFETLTRAPAVCMDLFTRQDYELFHGKQQPADWREAVPEDIRKATGRISPDVVFLSPPCKGFSGLLPSEKSKSGKYQALNRLVPRGLQLVLEAFRDDPPKVILLENVPRITTRGAGLLLEVKRLLSRYGYAFHEGYHDCGEIGGLGQHRKRYLLIARLENKMPSFIYRPPIRNLQTIGDVIGPLPVPDDPGMGPMHRLPRLQWKTWVRLALIPAGGDWRDLERGVKEWFDNAYRIIPWGETAGTVTSGHSPSCGATSVADPRLPQVQTRYHNKYQVGDWDDPAACVTGIPDVQAGAPSVADPRMSCLKEGTHRNIYRIEKWNEPAHVVTGATRPAGGALSIADPRLNPRGDRRSNSHLVRPWDGQAHTITGEDTIGSGAQSIADPRFSIKMYPSSYGVLKWEKPAPTVRGAVSIENAPVTVADPRIPFNNIYRVGNWDEPSGAVTSGSGPSSSGICVADPRLGCKPRNGTMGVQAWDKPGNTIIGAGDIHSGAAAVADPRIPSDNDRPDPPPVIIALDGTWHRPLTTLELAALQGFPVVMPDGRPLVLAGRSDSRWRERIGNAVPPPAARAVGEQILLALLQAEAGDWAMGSTGIWVRPEEQGRVIHG